MISQQLNLPDQQKSKDYKQVCCTAITTRRSTDKLYLTLGHEELVSIQPVRSVLIMDFEAVFTPSDARTLADSIYHQLEQMGVVPEK